ncbi:hypothetical protein EHO60_12920 [Leptospira fletcheri]|uniref:DUF1574 domain-containing protein n=1 Tax=Leptospira fletcheri TaxID=2484981 RepID=A0A4R9GD18_9LEPT|nr:hypothetical protein [Leptospira fletcheri]TGK08927.1 hypothetical protein EHO60_12920 [Leptospira fletcheri]
MNEKKTKVRVLFLSIAFLLSFFFLDRIIFSSILFNFPNELEWDTSPWYNFLEKRRRIRFDPDESGILAVGSSVALYSLFPDRLTENLRRKAEAGTNPIRAEFYAHPALTPSDFYYYREDIASKTPKLVVYVLNPADLQLDYLVSEKELKTGKLDPSIPFEEERLFSDFSRGRHQNRILYPAQFFRENARRIWKLGKPVFLELLSRSLFLLTRYRNFVYDPFDSFIEHHLRSGRSYHYYTGILPEEGIYLRGWTKPKFSIECELKNGKLVDSFFSQKKNTRLKIFQETPEELLLLNENFESRGWHGLELQFPGDAEKIRLRFETEPPVSSDEVDDRIFGIPEVYGLRLSQNFCRKDFRKDISYDRIPGIDDDRISALSDTAYLEDYEKRIYRSEDGEAALTRLKVIRMAKRKLRESDSYFSWSELEYLKKGIEFLEGKGVRVLLINSPENPLERSLYEESPWYKGYLSYLKNLGGAKYTFKDAKDLFSDKKDFLDPHHLTFRAARSATDEYSNWILSELSSVK